VYGLEQGFLLAVKVDLVRELFVFGKLLVYFHFELIYFLCLPLSVDQGQLLVRRLGPAPTRPYSPVNFGYFLLQPVLLCLQVGNLRLRLKVLFGVEQSALDPQTKH
jgi:hypothetical protein